MKKNIYFKNLKTGRYFKFSTLCVGPEVDPPDNSNKSFYYPVWQIVVTEKKLNRKAKK